MLQCPEYTDVCYVTEVKAAYVIIRASGGTSLPPSSVFRTPYSGARVGGRRVQFVTS